MAGAVTDLNKQLIEVRLEIDVALLNIERKNHYVLLGVGKQCDRGEIEASGTEWRRKIQRWSLVRGLPDDYHSRLKGLKQRIEEACRVLSNTAQRIHYDQQIRIEEALGQASHELPRTQRAQEVAAEPPVWGSGAAPDKPSSPQTHPQGPSPSQPSVRIVGSSPNNPVVRASGSDPHNPQVAAAPRPSSSPSNPQVNPSATPVRPTKPPPPRRTTSPWEAVEPSTPATSGKTPTPVEAREGSSERARNRTPTPVGEGVVFPPPLRRPAEAAPIQWQRPEVQPPLPSVPPARIATPTTPVAAVATSQEARIAALEAQLQATRAQIVALYGGISQAAIALELLLGSSDTPEQRRERLIQAAQIVQRLAATFPPR